MIVELVGEIGTDAILSTKEQDDERKREKFHKSVVARAGGGLKDFLRSRDTIERSEGR